ncbi:MAG: hypothetical protein ACRCSL_08315, partial [Microbacterium sp.]
MTFTPPDEPDPGFFDRVPEDAGFFDLVPEDLVWDAEVADRAPVVPDDVELVTDVAVMMSVFAAQRLERVEGL